MPLSILKLIELFKALIKGAVVGACLVTPAFIMFRLWKGFEEFGPTFLLFSNWLATVHLSALASIDWMPLGVMLGIMLELFKLSKKKSHSRTLIFSIGGICLVTGVIFAARQIATERYSDSIAIAARYSDFYSNYRSGSLDTAFSYMSPTYQQLHTLESFQSDFSFIDDADYELHRNFSVRFDGEDANLFPRNAYPMEVLWTGPELKLEKIEGAWYFTGDILWYWD